MPSKKKFHYCSGVNKLGPSKQLVVYTCNTRPRAVGEKWATGRPLPFFWLRASRSLLVAVEISWATVLGLFHVFHAVFHFHVIFMRSDCFLRISLRFEKF